MDVELNQTFRTDAAEAVDLTGLDHQDIAGSRLELLAIHGPQPAAFPDELNLVIWVAMRPRTASRGAVEEEHRNVHVAIPGADEVVRAATERQLFLTNAVH